MLKRLLHLLVVLLLVLVGLLSAAWAYAQTRIAKDQIGGLIERQLSDESQTAEVEGVGGLLPFDIRLGRFRLSDDKGVWLEVDDARLEMSPTKLLRGEIFVDQLGAARVAVARSPELPPSPPSEEPFSLPKVPELPKALPVFAAEHIRVDRIELGEPLLGEAAVLKLAGSVATAGEGNRLDARLDVVRIDKDTASASLSASVDLATSDIGLDLKASETGGLLAKLTQRPEAGALTISLTGSGPLSNWRARLDLEAERLLQAETDLGLAYGATPSIDLTARLVPLEGALPPDLAALIGERLMLTLRGGQQAPGQLTLETLKLESALLEVNGSAEASLEANSVDGRIVATIADLSRASAIAGTALGGQVVLTTTATGTFADPILALEINGRQIVAGDIGIGTLSSHFDVGLLAPVDQRFAGADVAGGVQLADLTQAGIPMRPEHTVDLNIEAHLPMQGQARINALSLRGEHVQANATAELNMPELSGTAKLEANVASLAGLIDRLGDMVPQEVAVVGSARLTADATIGVGARTVAADLALTTEGIAGLPTGADAIAGPTPSLRAHVDLTPGDNVAISDLRLDAAALGLGGRLGLGLDAGKALSGSVKLNIPALSVLEPVIHQPIAGKADFNVDLAGTLDAPDIRATVGIGELVVAGQSVDSVKLVASASGPVGAPGGKLDLSMVQLGRSLSIKSGYALVDDHLKLSDLAISGPSTVIGGALDVDLARTLASGRIQGRIDDLAALRPWHQQALSGVVELEANLSSADAKQHVEARVRVPKLAGDFGTVTSLDLTADVKDAFGKVGIDAKIDLGGFAQPGVEVTSGSVAVTGDLALLSINAAAKGAKDAGPFDVTAKARLDVMGNRRRVLLDALSGMVAEQKIELRSPATMVLDKGVLDIDQLDLLVGKAQVRGDATMGDGRIRAGLDLEGLPLGMLQALGAPPLTGTASGKLALRGRTAAPEADVEIRLAKVRPDDPFFAGKPGFDAVVSAKLASGRVEARAEIDGASKEPSVVTLAVPVRLSLEPLVFDLAATAPLRGRVDARADLARLAALAPLDGQTFAGILTADLDIDGRLDAPKLDGMIDLSGGEFQDSISGLALLFMKMSVEAKGATLVVKTLEARDGEGGKLHLSGKVDLAGARGVTYDMALDTDEMRVLNDEYGRAYVTTDLHAKGDGRGGAVSGKVTVDRANLQIPSGGGVDVVTLDVTEIGKDRPAQVTKRIREVAPAYPMKLAVEVDVPSRLFVRGRGLDSEWGGKLQINGAARDPEIAGSIDFRRGFLDFLDRRFDIRTGAIVFTGDVVPNLALEAAADGETLTAIVRISGPATKPSFTLDSEPSRPQDEVLADLLFKRNVSSLTPAQGVRLAAAVRSLEGGGIDTLGQLRDVIGLDTLDIGGESPSEATAKAGKYIADNVFLEVERGLASGSGKARVEIELNQNFSVNTEVREDAQSGVGIQWQLDY